MIVIGAAGAEFLGSQGNQFLNNIWDISDTLNGLMALPNLIGLLILSGVLKRVVDDYEEKYGTPADKALTPGEKVLVSKAQYITLGVIGVAFGTIAFFAHTTIFATLAAILGLVVAYKKQTWLGFLSVILAITAYTLI